MQPMPPGPPLDGVPPSPPGLSAGGGPNPSMSQLTPSAQMSGSMQVTQIALQSATQAAQLIDMIGQAIPSFAATSQMIIQQLRDGLKSALQQGPQPTPESQQSQGQGLIGMQGSAPQGGAPPQQPLPSLPSGM